jgi:hypothetical protein
MDRESRIEQLKLKHFKMNKPRAQRRPPVGGKWTEDEDNQLREIVASHGPRNWKKVISVRVTYNSALSIRRSQSFLERREQMCNVYTAGIKCLW